LDACENVDHSPESLPHDRQAHFGQHGTDHLGFE
jgi:hypothetical protein